METMLSIFCDRCEDAMGIKYNEQREIINNSLLYGLIVAAGMWVRNNPYGKRVKSIGQEAVDVWNDFALDFSCLPNTGIWSEVVKDSCTMEKLDVVENLEEFYDVLYDFFVKHIELFDDRI